MNRLTHEVLHLEKLVPLTISRGTITHSPVVWLRWHEEDHEGWGEAVPLDIGDHRVSLEDIVADLGRTHAWIDDCSAWDRHTTEQRSHAAGISSALMAGINQAQLDWLGKRLGQPIRHLLGLPATAGPLTSVTIGILSPDAARERVRRWREVGDVRAFKIKLGSPAGIAADQAMFAAVKEEIGRDARVSVDANGGWSVSDACTMAAWLAARAVDHLEQPLPRGQEVFLNEVRAASPMPVIVDESCVTSHDVARLARMIDGVNLKLTKCGGLDEAMRIIATARAHRLKILVGCYGNTTLGNAAAAVLGPVVDYLDLDSHLNLKDDPFRGLALGEGRLRVSSEPGCGVAHV